MRHRQLWLPSDKNLPPVSGRGLEWAGSPVVFGREGSRERSCTDAVFLFYGIAIFRAATHLLFIRPRNRARGSQLIVINAEGSIEAEHEVDFSIYNLDHVSNHDYVLISETSIQKFSPDFQRLEWKVDLPDVLDSYKIFNGVLQVYTFEGTKLVFDGLTGEAVKQ